MGFDPFADLVREAIQQQQEIEQAIAEDNRAKYQQQQQPPLNFRDSRPRHSAESPQASAGGSVGSSSLNPFDD